MPKRSWRSDLALGIVVVAVVVGVIATLGFWKLAEQQARHERPHNDAAAHDTRDPGEQREADCRSIPGAKTTVCVVEAPDSTADQQRANQDLHAQQEMADWALGMFFVTLASVATTIIGLIYVVLAYRLNAEATQYASKAADAATDANKQTRAQFVAERRPWISCEIEHPIATTTKNNVTVHFAYVLTNHGQSPATDVSIRLNKVGVFDEEHRTLFEHMSVVERQRPATGGGDVVFPSERTPLKLKRSYDVPHDTGPSIITGWVRYRFEGANRYHLTPFKLVVGMRIKLFDSGPRVDHISVDQDTAGIAPD